MKFKIGYGYDVHAFAENRKLILGGIQIPYEKGLLGHSDADVAIHSLMDAILGAMSYGDIGKLFPDTDMKYKDIDSKKLLEKVYQIMNEKGFMFGNCDMTISCQEPKLSPYIDSMRQCLSNILKTDLENISIKATTTEHLGFEGRKEGISVSCICLLEKIESSEKK